jgi:hypothetical protein
LGDSKRQETSENISCAKSHNSEDLNHTEAQASNLVICLGMLNTVCIHLKQVRIKVSMVGVVRLLYGQPRNSSAIPYRTKNKSSILRVPANYGEHTQAFSIINASFLFGDKADGT